ncbi:hypothetical protein RRG08_044645 [Elysia crispata]|uniref:Uncharacterized protein n=1 Tax=Elysia crispata TaxID=231223 RepID=A0AAE1B4T4_9GAST|nr:hypothetical protein RRG08_044645 [Elysia crispata]
MFPLTPESFKGGVDNSRPRKPRANCYSTSVSPFDAELGIELQDVISAAEHNAGGLHLDTNAWLVSFD